MSTTQTQEFVLVGPHEGKTMTVNGHPFVDGLFNFTGSSEQIASLTRVFSYYAAVPKETAELMALRARVAELAPVGGTAPAVPQQLEPAIDEVPVDAQPAAPAPADEQPAPPVEEVGSPEANDPVDSSEGKPDLGVAIGLLDPEVDSHWTSNNLPSLERLSELTGRRVGRSEVEALAEGYTRAKAKAARQ